jgi:murein L,D-transpeptidase YcbB/YkuD
MKNIVLSVVIILFGFSMSSVHCIGTENQTADSFSIAQARQKPTVNPSEIVINEAVIADFFKKYPDLKKHQPDVSVLYKKRNYNPVWYDEKGLINFARLLHTKVNVLEEEGLNANMAYKDKIDRIFDSNSETKVSPTDTELLLSTMYLFYVQKVFNGIDTKKIREIGWFLPRKTLSYTTLLDSVIANPELLNKNEKQLFKQYYKLREALKKYRQIEKKGAWNFIEMDTSVKVLKPLNKSKTILQIRQRLAVTGDLKTDSKSNVYDQELMNAVLNYKKRNGLKLNYNITHPLLRQMNGPIATRIKTIIVNMERCRWIPPELTKTDEYLIINIPSFTLLYKKNGKTELESKVFVGKIMTETVIFSANMTQIVFSPYWNLPRSIIDYELKLNIKEDKNYLESHNMEWNNGNVRQKPGPKNSLGLVKFVFPNSNDIYLHDTPVKSLFEYETRAFSHGCINVSKAKELAFLLLKDDPDWPVSRINEAMKGVKETTCELKRKIPVHIGYFTAWVNDAGEINFYTDVYDRDDRLAELVFAEDSKKK